MQDELMNYRLMEVTNQSIRIRICRNPEKILFTETQPDPERTKTKEEKKELQPKTDDWG